MTTASLIRPARCRAHRQHGAHTSAPSRQRSGEVVTGGPADRYRRAHRPAGVPVRRSTASAGAPNFVARRLAAAVCALSAAVAVVSVAGSFVAGFGGAPAAAAEAQPLPSGAAPPSPTYHVAQPGDTLWSIASAYRGAVDHGRYVEALVRLNGGASIEVGQAVRLP